jgi:hypothetical protein
MMTGGDIPAQENLKNEYARYDADSEEIWPTTL